MALRQPELRHRPWAARRGSTMGCLALVSLCRVHCVGGYSLGVPHRCNKPYKSSFHARLSSEPLRDSSCLCYGDGCVAGSI